MVSWFGSRSHSPGCEALKWRQSLVAVAEGGCWKSKRQKQRNCHGMTDAKPRGCPVSAGPINGSALGIVGCWSPPRLEQFLGPFHPISGSSTSSGHQHRVHRSLKQSSADHGYSAYRSRHSWKPGSNQSNQINSTSDSASSFSTCAAWYRLIRIISSTNCQGPNAVPGSFSAAGNRDNPPPPPLVSITQQPWPSHRPRPPAPSSSAASARPPPGTSPSCPAPPWPGCSVSHSPA